MSKTGLILFARVESNEELDDTIEASIKNILKLDDKFEMHFIGFGPSTKKITPKNKFSVYESLDIRLFQNIVCEKLKLFSNLGYNKSLIISCGYEIQNKQFFDKNLTIVSYDDSDFMEKKNLNHRFMYGRTTLLKRIWENKSFDITKDLDKNLFLNVFNVIGFSKMNENRINMDGFMNRTEWIFK